jgi:hypothetical protein
MHPSGRRGNIVQTLVSVREESRVLYRYGLGRQLATIWMLGQHCPDAALKRKRVKRVMIRQLQFTVQTLSTYFWTPLKELRISVEIDFLKPINRGL